MALLKWLQVGILYFHKRPTSFCNGIRMIDNFGLEIWLLSTEKYGLKQKGNNKDKRSDCSKN